VEADPRRFFVPPYVGPRGWIGIRLDRRPNWAIVAALIEEGHRKVAAPRRARGAPAGRKRTLPAVREGESGPGTR
jgi:hypothetical protein